MDQGNHKKHSRHILPNIISLRVFLALVCFTFLTVMAAHTNFREWNFPIAMFISTVKASLVMLFFMGLKYDNNENRVVFLASFVFFGFFIFYVAADLLNRPADYRVTGSFFKQASSSASGPTFDKPWVATPEILAYGKKVFHKQACYTCHGETGQGDGPAGLALHARNFTKVTGWKKGRKVTQVFETITHGLGAMPTFANIPVMDRWAAAQYVLHFGPPPPKSTIADLKAIGVDPTKKGGGMIKTVKHETIPIDFAIERYLHEK